MPITAPPTIPLITDPSTFAVRAQDWVVWQSDELYPFISETSAILALSTTTISVTSNTIGTGLKSFTVQTGKGFVAGQSLSIAYTTTPTNRMFAVVNSYNSGTGALSVNVQGFEGSGTYTAWSISTTGYTRAVLSNYGIGTNDVEDYAGDTNNLVEGGMYFSTGINTPTPQPYFIIATTNGVNNSMQLAVRQGTNSLYVRTSSTGVWSSWTNLVVPVASETVKGIVELATSAEATAGTSDLTVLTPLKLRNGLNASGSAPIYACRAWVNFNGTLAAASMIQASGNVSSITDNGAGDYTINFTTAMPDVDYCLSSWCRADIASASAIVSANPAASKTTSAIRITTKRANDAITLTDMAEICVTVFR